MTGDSRPEHPSPAPEPPPATPPFAQPGRGQPPFTPAAGHLGSAGWRAAPFTIPVGGSIRGADDDALVATAGVAPDHERRGGDAQLPAAWSAGSFGPQIQPAPSELEPPAADTTGYGRSATAHEEDAASVSPAGRAGQAHSRAEGAVANLLIAVAGRLRRGELMLRRPGAPRTEAAALAAALAALLDEQEREMQRAAAESGDAAAGRGI